MLSNVFNVPVAIMDHPDAAALGASYRAWHGWKCKEEKAWHSFTPKRLPLKTILPQPGMHARYTLPLKSFGHHLKKIVHLMRK